jgi:hypothetical protein
MALPGNSRPFPRLRGKSPEKLASAFRAWTERTGGRRDRAIKTSRVFPAVEWETRKRRRAIASAHLPSNPLVGCRMRSQPEQSSPCNVARVEAQFLSEAAIVVGANVDWESLLADFDAFA